MVCRSQRKIDECGEKLVECSDDYDAFELCKKIQEVILGGGLKNSVIITLWTAVVSVVSKVTTQSPNLSEMVCDKSNSFIYQKFVCCSM